MENIYKILFFFNGQWEYADMTANQIAMKVIEDSVLGDSVWEVFKKYNEQYFEYKFKRGGKTYLATFSLYDVNKINVYEVVDNDDEYLVEADIPYTVLAIKNNDEVIYKLSDYTV